MNKEKLADIAEAGYSKLSNCLTAEQAFNVIRATGKAIWDDMSLGQKIASVSLVSTTIPMVVTASILTHPARVTREWARKAWEWTKAV
jgi:hypothetical protein